MDTYNHQLCIRQANEVNIKEMKKFLFIRSNYYFTYKINYNFDELKDLQNFIG